MVAADGPGLDQPHVEIGPLRRQRQRREPTREAAADDGDIAAGKIGRHISAPSGACGEAQSRSARCALDSPRETTESLIYEQAGACHCGLQPEGRGRKDQPRGQPRRRSRFAGGGRTLLWDLDGQAAASFILGHDGPGKRTAEQVFDRDIAPAKLA